MKTSSLLSWGTAWLAGMLAAALLGGSDVAAQEFLWGKQFSTARDTYARAVATDPAGNVVVVGSGYDGDQSDAWITKYTGDGGRIWQRPVATRKNDYAGAVVTDSFGNIFVTGSTGGRLDGNNSDYRDVWVAKYADDGSRLWIRQFGAVKKDPNDQPPADTGNGIAVDAAGNLFIVGTTTGIFQPAHFGDPDLFLIKLDRDGNQVWARQLGDEVLWGYGYSVAIDAATGDIFVGGRVRPTDYWTSRICNQGYLARYDEDGNRVWELRLGKRNTFVNAIVTDDAGGVVAAGYTDSLAGIRKSAFVARYDGAGTFVDARRIGPAGNPLSVSGLARDPNDRLFVAGNVTYGKAWIAELGASLAPVWTKTLIAVDPNSTGPSVQAAGLAADGNSGRVFATGYVSGLLFGNQPTDTSQGWVGAWQSSQP